MMCIFFGEKYGLGQPVSAEIIANTFTKGDQFGPSIAAFADGSYLVAWTSQGQDGDGSGVFIQRFDGQGGRIK